MVLLLMAVLSSGSGRDDSAFVDFFAAAEPRLRQALVSTYGPVDGRAAAVDALSWAWEHWDRLHTVSNKVAYLYRVGQSAARRYAIRPLPTELLRAAESRIPDCVPELIPALARLSGQQRTVVLLVHAYGWTQADVAELLGVNASTVREHLGRALSRLRHDLEVRDAC